MHKTSPSLDKVLTPALSRAVHLLPAGELFEQGYPRTRVAVCGQPVTTAPQDGGEDPGYCAECICAALRWWLVSADIPRGNADER
jgi:hypothetical protein